MRVAIVAVASYTGETGGAEKFFEGLHKAFNTNGHQCQIIKFTSNESSIESIKETYEKCKNIDLSSFDCVISTKSPSYAVAHPNHVVYLVHTMRVFYDMFDKEFSEPNEDLLKFRKEIIEIDTFEMTKPGIRKIYTIGKEVSKRLAKYNFLESEVLYPPMQENIFRSGVYENYLFIPSRLHRWKRIDLIIEAMKYIKSDVELRIAGIGEDESNLKKLAKGNKKIKFLGHISEEEKIQQYANCLLVPFVPINEDYGYVTLEAFSSQKPVITCMDSGEPSNLVVDSVSGYICSPDPKMIAKKIDILYKNKDLALKMGLEGFKSIQHISWENVVQSLTKVIDRYDNDLVVFDMQPIEPAVGGGRIRLFGLYHKLGAELSTLYVGSYDWKGEKYRDHWITEKLREINIPLSEKHFEVNEELTNMIGANAIDLTFHQTAHLSMDFLKHVIYHVIRNKIIVFSHPWIYPLVKKYLTKDHIIIYDSQNVESFLRYSLHKNNIKMNQIIQEVAQIEYELCNVADLILCCSHEDRTGFNKIYDTPYHKMEVAPNGVLTTHIKPEQNNSIKSVIKRKYFNNQNKVALFIGSGYGPNVNAAFYIIDVLSIKLPNVNFIIAGSVGDLLSNKLAENIFITGFIDEKEKIEILKMSDFAINPMEGGSGTNIKMFDFMAAGLPIISTEIGARGINILGSKALRVVEICKFSETIEQIISNEILMQEMSKASRMLAEEQFSFEKISYKLGYLIQSLKNTYPNPPKVSIVIPSYERHELLLILLGKLSLQTFENFEVIVIDQSKQIAEINRDDYIFDLNYIHSPIKGAVKARNYGAMLARGRIIGFIDDDCYPMNIHWIENAYNILNSSDEIIGIEGKVLSDHLNNPEYRSVSNVGFEGLGFMTANLFIKKEVFNKINGFDESFDNPHFREDTDLGWRASLEGSIPYSHDVVVFHPAHKKSQFRESDDERYRFFVKDPLLLIKHPNKYYDLFLFEKHYENPMFWKYFDIGLENIDISSLSNTINEALSKVMMHRC